MGSPRPVLVFFGHHRCGSTWFDGILRAVCRELRLRHAYVHNAKEFGHDLGAFVERQRLDCVSYVNSDYREVARLRPYRGVHVIRDPRDVAVSCFFAHRYSHDVDGRWPELREHRAVLERLPQEEGLIYELEQLAWQFECMRTWQYHDPDILELTMEALTADPYRQMIRVFHFLGLSDPGRLTIARRSHLLVGKGLRTIEKLSGDRFVLPLGPRRLPVERLLGIVWEHDFEHLSGGRQRGEEDPRSHYRKGTPGDWRNHFTAAHVAVFKARYPELLAELGYEPDDVWQV